MERRATGEREVALADVSVTEWRHDILITLEKRGRSHSLMLVLLNGGMVVNSVH